jgi:hypothetical protein
MNITQVCDECRGQQFVESHGELTCINCGLVKQSFTIAATEIYQKDPHNEYVACGFKKWTKTYLDNLKHLSFLDEYFFNIAGSWFDELQVSSSNFAYYGTLCSFYVSVYTRRGINPQMFADIFDVNINSAWDFSSKVLSQWQGKPWYNDLKKMLNAETDRFDRLKRCVYGLWFIDHKRHFEIIKKCDRIWSKIKGFPQITCLKSNSLYCTLVVVACKSCKIEVDANALCKEFNVTMCTVKQNELLIQQAIRTRTKKEAARS